jgi:hypothetical protein
MLSIGEDLVFVEMVHDVAVDYMLQYLSCDGGEGNRSIVGGYGVLLLSVLCLACPISPVSLDWALLIFHSVFSND